MSRIKSSSPSTDPAAARTAAMQSGWKSTAGEVLSVCHLTVNSFSLDLGNAGSSTFWPRAMAAKSRFSSASTASTVLSAGARTSRLKRTWPGMVFTLPGDRVRTPVEARATCLAAILCEWAIRRAAMRRASARAEKGVVPVCASTITRVSASASGPSAGTRKPTSACNVNGKPLVSLNTLHDTNLPPFRLKDRSLFDVKLEMRCHGQCLITSWNRAKVSYPFEFRFHGCCAPAYFPEGMCSFERYLSRPHTGRDHAYWKSSAFFTTHRVRNW
jgi:hypothetical protein